SVLVERVDLPFQAAGVDPLAAGRDANFVGVVRIGNSLEGYQYLHDALSLLGPLPASASTWGTWPSQGRRSIVADRATQYDLRRADAEFFAEMLVRPRRLLQTPVPAGARAAGGLRRRAPWRPVHRSSRVIGGRPLAQ